jgi:3-oxoacyl-[acyl-carrier-protein] synthase II
MERRVVITACSAITPIGHGKDQIIESLLKGISGIKPLQEDQLISRFIHSKVYGTVDYPVEYDFKRQYRKTMGPVAYYACQVAKEVLEQSGLPQDFITSGKMGVAFGSIHGSPTIQRDIYRIFLRQRIKPLIKASALLIT